MNNNTESSDDSDDESYGTASLQPSEQRLQQLDEDQQLDDSFTQEELEISQSLVQNVTPCIIPLVTTDPGILQREERAKVDIFLRDGCGCELANGPCSSTFSADYVDSYRSQCQ